MNIMIEPEFHFNVIDGTATITTATDSKGKALGGNAKGNWVDVTPTGTAFVAVNYEALDVYTSADAHGTHGGFYPANDPARTSVFVVSSTEAVPQRPISPIIPTA